MITIFTDGACNKNHIRKNIGGWAYVILNEFGVKTREDSGKEIDTTNNRMEIMAMLKALEIVNNHYKNEEVTIFSDSQYVINTLTLNWKKNKNNDLWDKIIPLMSPKVHLKWVKGHNGNAYNEYVDQLASGQTKDSTITIIKS